ncbi:MAG: class I SAM-dependent methyltransferase, partial [Aggregatilineales bacterium]
RRGFIGADKHVLDIGTGTGTLARGAALSGSSVIGLDIAPALLKQAKHLDKAAGVDIDYQVAPAEETGLVSGMFDTVMAGQCWHWFDRPRAAQEVRRLLKPGGTALIAHLDWIPLPGNVVDATETLILKYNPQWAMHSGTGLYPAWLSDLAIAGFTGIETVSFDTWLTYTHEAWRGRIRASAGVAASLLPSEVIQFDTELSDLLTRRFPENPLQVHHRIWAVFASKSPADSI